MSARDEFLAEMLPRQIAAEVSRTNRHVASLFSNCAANGFELLAVDVSGDLAYTVGYERHSTSIGGELTDQAALTDR